MKEMFVFYQIHKKLGEILDVVYFGYIPSKYIFVPQSVQLSELFELLRSEILLIDRGSEFQKLKIVDFRLFSLNDNFNDMIEYWTGLRNSFFEDDAMIGLKI